MKIFGYSTENISIKTLLRHTQQSLNNNNINNMVEGGMFDPASYTSVHNLAVNSDKRNFEDLLKKTVEAIFMMKCLKFNGFFGDPRNPPPEMSRAIVFVSSLLLRYCWSM